MKVLLIISIILTIVYMMVIITGVDRFMTPLPELISNYATKPLAPKRVVVVFECKGDLNENTLKSILDQSFRVSDIAIETKTPQLINDETKRVVTIHKPGTTHLREPDADTVVLFLEADKVYDYDFIENSI